MPFQRDGCQTWTFKGKLGRQWLQVSTGSTSKPLAKQLEKMWDSLAEEWAFDILGKVHEGALSLPELYEAWEQSRHHLAALRKRLADRETDPNLSELVERWYTVHAGNVKPDSAAHALRHVRWLLPEGNVVLASMLTAERLELYLAEYEGARNTRRKVHSSWSVYFAWCAKHRYIRNSPMADVSRPKQEVGPISFYELPEVLRIVDAQPDAERRAFMALMYGTGADLSIAVAARRDQIDPSNGEIRLPGTKTANRDRVAKIATWAWPYIEPHMRAGLTQARLFQVDRWEASRWHREIVVKLSEALQLSAKLPLRCARHHWAVRSARAGVPMQAIAAQLGNTVHIAQKTYARFEAREDERSLWEAKASAADARQIAGAS
jgi:integrase